MDRRSLLKARGDILIIDDTPANLQLLSSILIERGHEVRAVISGEMGLMAAQAIVPDLILLDIKMPGLNGYQVCAQLKASDNLCNIPVIFISSAEETIDKVKAFNLGAVDYITKPFQVEEVIARVESQLILASTHQQMLELATIRERQHIARDLHDTVSQTLFSISMAAETLLFQYEEKPERIKEDLNQIHALSQSALAEMRMLLFELRPEAILKARLADLLNQLGTVISKRINIKISLQLNDEILLPADVHLALYRITQEALNNITKHARANHIKVVFDSTTDQTTLMIQDNGRGFEYNDDLPGHFGLRNMKERAEGIGAHLEIHSAPGQGTEIVVHWKEKKDRIF